MKFLFDLFPIILFFAAFKAFDIYVATGVVIAATMAQIGWVWHRHGKVDTMLWVSLALVVVFGGATLILHDETFIKWKPTILYWLFAVTLFGSAQFFGKNLQLVRRRQFKDWVRRQFQRGRRRKIMDWVSDASYSHSSSSSRLSGSIVVKPSPCIPCPCRT